MTRTATWLGANRIDLDECESTNAEASRLSTEDGAAHGTLVTARAQTAGRGRQGNAWHSPPGGNLYFSIVLRPDMPVARVPPVTLAAGLAVADAMHALDVPATLKWPNDILVDGRKLSGILTETSSRGDRLEHAIMGVGINVNTREFPGKLENTATSIALELAPSDPGFQVDGEAVLQGVLGELERRLDQFFEGGVQAIAGEWMTRSGFLGRRIRVAPAIQGLPRDYPSPVYRDKKRIDGRVRGIDDTGALKVEDKRGRVHVIAAGIITIVD